MEDPEEQSGIGRKHSDGEKSCADNFSKVTEKENASQASDTADAVPKAKVKTIAFCRFLVRKYKLAFGLFLGCHLLTLLLTAILMRAGYDILPVDFGRVPLELREDDTFRRSMAWSYRDEDGSILQKDTSAATIGERTRIGETITLYYEADNVFTADNLRVMADFEEQLTSVTQYGNYCRLFPSTSCQKPDSIIRFFDGTYGPSFNDSSYSSIASVLASASRVPVLSQRLQFHLGREAVINASTGTASSSVTRSVLYFGLPFQDYDLRQENKSKQSSMLQDFLVAKYYGIFQSKIATGVGGMSFLFESQLLFSHEISSTVTSDLLLLAGGFSFIFLFMLVQTQSLLITSLGIFSIITSFIGANLIYRIIFDFKYFGIFHVLAVFIILGIGADDIFVYFDTWRGSAHEQHDSLEARVSSCFRHASKSMFITSLTTMIAFFANAFSPLLAVKSFGLFAGLVVLVNYASVVTFFPSLVLVHHLHWESWAWPCFRPCAKTTVRPHDSSEDGHRKFFIVRFFRGPFFRFVTHKVMRWVVIVVSLALLAVFAYFASLLQMDEESTKIFKDGHPLMKAQAMRSTRFKPSQQERVVTVFLVWGLKFQDLSRCHHTDFACTGTTVWDEGFDLNPKPAQRALLDLCESIKNMTDAENTLYIRRNSVTGKMDVDCFISAMATAFSRESNLTGQDFNLPAAERKLTNFMNTHLDLYNTSALGSTFYRYFETGMSYWLNDGYSGTSTLDYTTYFGVLGETEDRADTTPILSNSRYQYGTRLRYAAITVYTNITGSLGYNKGAPILDAWESWTKAKMAALPPSLSGGFQTTASDFNTWHWLKVQKELADSAVRGIILGICLACPILILATQNLVLGLLATLIICCVTVTVIGVIPLGGWKLGVLESLNLSFVVGLAVDYVVHLAEGYHLSRRPDRGGRVQDMLETVGVSVLSGACTTLGASLFMLLAVILFFMQFGIFMFCTIMFSIFYSLLLFTACLGLLGPQEQFGSLAPLWACIHRILVGRAKTDVTCSRCMGNGFHPLTEEAEEAT